MKRIIAMAGALAVIGLGSSVVAQGPGGEQRGERGGERRGDGGGERGGPRPSPLATMPLMIALDLDKNSEVSAEEMDKAASSLRSLDKNNDGKLTAAELLPASFFARRGPGPAEHVRLMEFDANKDGKLVKTEVPERVRGIFVRADTNKDGVLTRDELLKYAESIEPPPAGPEGARPEGGRPGGEGGRGQGPRGEGSRPAPANP